MYVCTRVPHVCMFSRRLRTDRLRLEACRFARLLQHLILPIAQHSQDKNDVTASSALSQSASFLCSLLEANRGWGHGAEGRAGFQSVLDPGDRKEKEMQECSSCESLPGRCSRTASASS